MGDIVGLKTFRQRQLDRERQRLERKVHGAGLAYAEAVQAGAAILRGYRRRGSDDAPVEQVVGLANMAAIRRKASRLREAEQELCDWLAANVLPRPVKPEIEIAYADEG